LTLKRDTSRPLPRVHSRRLEEHDRADSSAVNGFIDLCWNRIKICVSKKRLARKSDREQM